MTSKPAVTVNEPGRAFGWLGRLGGVPHIFDGAHRFELEPIDGGRRTRFVQSERFQTMNRALADQPVAQKTAAAKAAAA